ncbi:aldolase/citrate lyase family protein [Saxibacter everestensis]|uniref:Aldolase/citrate lyase family protein n=1 Tax=Saxibacter everestensis TaxID=2909229 RepID=A0ABY8QR22_9MICO|nr:aldolase/citrate lyase family protein [Brevibacteriaceae bacterium ZFBP1038]
MAPRLALAEADLARIDATLRGTDDLLDSAYPGDDGSRQPVHTVYVPADTFTPGLAADWGRAALAAAEEAGGLEALAASLGLTGTASAEKVARKLEAEPIEDLRLDFEDGYGDRPDDEDNDVIQAARQVNEAVRNGTAPPYIGIRFKCFEAATRARALRTLDLFIGELIETGGLPDGLVLTLPKVSTVEQVEAMVDACSRLEAVHGLTEGRLRFEVQMETPQLVLGADGTVPLARALHSGAGRVSALHYGTYDYSASLQIAARYQSMEHPAADYAKQVMQVAVAGTGVRLSDGSTNVLPVGSPENRSNAWKLHARLVRRSLERGYYQGWDLHAAQLPSRYLATYAFYRDGFSAAALRLKNYVHKIDGDVLDEPATARALAQFIHRGVLCGALDDDEVRRDAGVDSFQLAAIAHPKTAMKSEDIVV